MENEAKARRGFYAYFERLVDPFRLHPMPGIVDVTFASVLKFYIWQSRWVFLSLAIFTAGSAVTETLMITIIGDLVNDLSVTRGAEEGDYVIFVLFAILIARFLCGVFQDIFIHQTISPSFTDLVRWNAFHNVINKDMLYFQAGGSGKIATYIMQSSQAIRNIIIDFFRSIWFVAIFVISSTVALLDINLVLLTPIAVWAIFTYLIISYFIPALRGGAVEAAEARSQLAGRMTDIFSNIVLIKLFSSREQELGSVGAAISENLQKFRLQMRNVTLFSALVLATNVILVAACALLSIYLWRSGAAKLGDVAVVQAVSVRLYGVSNSTMWKLNAMLDSVGTIQNGIQIHDPKPGAYVSPERKVSENVRGHIEFENVTFAYGASSTVLQEVSFTALPGDKLAITGPSGAGKSTIFNLLLKLHSSYTGTIRVDGQDIRELSDQSVRECMSVVSQDHAVLNRSVRENLLLGNRKFEDDQLYSALEAVKAADFVMALKDNHGNSGLDAILGERGSSLSGGQRQRLAIARAILKQAPILILDEPTSALDSLTEAAVQYELEKLVSGRTVLAVAHRLSTIAHFDKILVLKGGTVLQSGRHDQLAVQDGLYADLWHYQTSLLRGLSADG